MHIKGNKKIINSWAMYDWANSVYSLVITSTLFPIYYTLVTTSDTDKVNFLGREFINSSLYSYAISFAFLLIAAISPFLSSIADYSGTKKGFMRFFCYMGSLACMALYFFEGYNLELGIFALIIATIGFSGSIVFYNAYLPEIAEIKDQDRVSAKGFAFGYIGSSILLVFNLIMIQYPGWFWFQDNLSAIRFSFFLTGLWWIGFAQITFSNLPKNIYNRQPKGDFLLNGYKKLLQVWKQLKQLKYIRIFLFSFFFYSMRVQTVMYVASLFVEKEVNMESYQLILAILIIQFVAIAGSFLFARLSGKFGNIRALILAVLVWIGICIGAFFVYDAHEFYLVAFFVGLVMGGVQSLSRSTYSKLLPKTKDHASFFSFYDICEKVAIVLGTTTFGLTEELTGSMRNSIIALTVFFLVGLILLLCIRKVVINSNK